MWNSLLDLLSDGDVARFFRRPSSIYISQQGVFLAVSHFSNFRIYLFSTVTWEMLMCRSNLGIGVDISGR